MKGYGVTIIPASWAIGKWKKGHKTILAFGPLRLTVHYDLGEWKKSPFPANPRGRQNRLR
jgi:hypothetical protein